LGAFLILYITDDMPTGSFQEVYQKNMVQFVRSLHPWKTDPENEFLSILTPHPYFGYVYRGIDKSINNSGFWESYDFPYKKKKNDFVVGILGGSVASTLGLFLKQEPFFLKELKRRLPVLRGKNIVILNLAVPAYKQPQQFFVASYYLDILDMAINIEGFNEGSIYGQFKHNPIDFPTYYINPEGQLVERVQKKLAERSRFYRRIKMKVTKLCHNISKQVNIGGYFMYLSWYTVKRITDNKVVELNDLYHKIIQTINSREKPLYLSLEDEAKRRYQIWKKYISLENLILRSKSIPVIFILQPSVYFQGSKKLTTVEKKYLADELKAKMLRKFYQHISNDLSQLRKEGISIFDFRNVFKKIEKTTYTDDCHFNELGEAIVRKKILEVIEGDDGIRTMITKKVFHSEKHTKLRSAKDEKRAAHNI